MRVRVAATPKQFEPFIDVNKEGWEGVFSHKRKMLTKSKEKQLSKAISNADTKNSAQVFAS